MKIYGLYGVLGKFVIINDKLVYKLKEKTKHWSMSRKRTMGERFNQNLRNVRNMEIDDNFFGMALKTAFEDATSKEYKRINTKKKSKKLQNKKNMKQGTNDGMRLTGTTNSKKNEYNRNEKNIIGTNNNNNPLATATNI